MGKQVKLVSRFLHTFCAFSLLSQSSIAQADDWGCEVLLCLSNPAGPTAVAECVPPIRKLWRALARGHAFPTCLMGNSQNHNAQHEWASVKNCPPGYLAQDFNGDYYCLMRGVVTVTVNGVVQSRTWWSDTDVPQTEGEGALSPSQPASLPAPATTTRIEP